MFRTTARLIFPTFLVCQASIGGVSSQNTQNFGGGLGSGTPIPLPSFLPNFLKNTKENHSFLIPEMNNLDLNITYLSKIDLIKPDLSNLDLGKDGNITILLNKSQEKVGEVLDSMKEHPSVIKTLTESDMDQETINKTVEMLRKSLRNRSTGTEKPITTNNTAIKMNPSTILFVPLTILAFRI